MNYIDLLRNSANGFKSIVCMGADPLVEKIPLEGSVEEKISKFYSDIIDACISENVVPAAVKPNYAFYAQYGFEGLRALKTVCEKVKASKIPLILDGKRGDIGKTSAAYAKELFDFWDADAVTLAPYMGSDSVGPFIEYCEQKGKGCYILNRTSNKGAVDLQNLIVEGKPLFLKVSEKIVEWGSKANGNVGAVVGATSLNELEQISAYYASTNKKVPLLIPGVGSQGGSAKEVTEILKKTNNELAIQRINSSSEINYAYQKQETDDFAGAAVKAIKQLNDEIKFK